MEELVLEKNLKLTKLQITGFNKLGIYSVKDLLYHFPVRFLENSDEFNGSLKKGQFITIVGTIAKIGKRRSMGQKRVMITEATVHSQSKSIKAIWFHQPYIAHQFKEGDVVSLQGEVSGSKSLYLTNPVIRISKDNTPLFSDNKKSGEYLSVYAETKKISSLLIRSKIEKLFENNIHTKIPDLVPEDILTELNLPSLSTAFKWIHTPKTKGEYEVAKKRFLFEIIFLMQIKNQRNIYSRINSSAYEIYLNKKDTKQFIKDRFEFKPTNAQLRVIDEIFEDIKQNIPMARLLEGDVGSGKTAVAAAIMHGIVSADTEEKTSGRAQAVYLAPTEILAKQQFETLIKYFSHLPIEIGLLTSKGCMKFPSKVNADEATDIPKATLLKWINEGTISLLVGTHAVIQKNVNFKRLAMAIIDEQHRFGVAQRHSILQKTTDHTPHLLSMTATPIPRTLALTIYGDLDLSVIDELPVGRKTVKTKLISRKEIDKLYSKIKEEIEKGHQAYVLCPRIEETDKSDLISVEEEFKNLKDNIFPDLNIDILHGKMKKIEKETVMKRFVDKEIDILVTTTVIEVGVNVPNATVIGILHAERFGVAQLHQLRGRVIRSNFEPFCFPVTDSTGEETLKRLKMFEKEHNGFKLAEEDLENRGSGEIAGLKQSGIPDLAFEGLKNPKLLSIAKEKAKKIIKEDFGLKKHKLLKEYIDGEVLHGE